MDLVKESNWADLPSDLLHLIAKKFSDISDFIHSRAVCKPWRSSISISLLSPQFPWIMKRRDGPHLEFYSIASNKVYTIHAPNSSNKELFGPAEGYMFARPFDRCNHFSLMNPVNNNFSLLNPVNNSEVSLPPLDGSKIVVSWIGPQNFQSDNYVIVAVLFTDYKFRLAICKAGDDKWDHIEESSMRSYFYLNSLLFIVDEYNTGVTKVMDIDSRKEAYVIPPPEDEELPLFLHVESCGEILRVGYRFSHEVTDNEFSIHRLEFGNGKGYPCWVKVMSIDNQMLFLDFVARRGFCLNANDFPGFKGNCIYIINKVSLECLCAVSMFDIENGRTVSIDCPFDFKDETESTWFMPTLNHI